MRVALTLILVFAALAMARADGVAVSVSADQSVRDVVDELRAQGHPFIYSSVLLPEDLKVIDPPTSSDLLGAVREILKPHGLTVREEAGIYVIARKRRDAKEPGGLTLVISAGPEQRAVADASIELSPAPELAIAARAGVYEIAPVSAGRYELWVDAPGLASVYRTVDVFAGETRVMNIRMKPEQTEIEAITVSASRYEILRDSSPSLHSIDRRSIELMPDLGEDPLRSVHRLPGAAASGASAQAYLRGGDSGEVGIWLNGQKLFDPYHIRDYQNVFSAIDARAVEGVEVYTGGFPVRYGNRMSGMVLLQSLDPLDPTYTELGLSVYNTSVLHAGRNGDRHWLFSARRGNLDLVIRPEFGRPSYFDVFGEYGWDLTPQTEVSLNALSASDRVEIVLETDPDELEQVVSDTDTFEVWVQADTAWSDRLSSKTVLSATRFDNRRAGSLGDEEKIVGSVFDERSVRRIGFRQDFEFHPSDRHLMQWGLQIRESKADYTYRNAAEYYGLTAAFDGFDAPRERSLEAAPRISSYSLYVANRSKLTPRRVFEWGLRWDSQSYTGTVSDSQLSPRFSLLQSIGERTELRLSWGRYHQAQEINELQVEDGLVDFWPAQHADHLIAGLKHRLTDRHSLRIELFDKDIRDVQPRFENLFDPLGLIPEIQPDRVLIAPDRANARGVEVTLDYSSGALDWWASYTLSKASDRVRGVSELRSWDQRHALVAGISWSNVRWEWALAANIHSGWPLTELSLVANGTDADGEPAYRAVPGPRNAGRHNTFASLDLRLARTWKPERGRVTAFLEVSNALNRKNACCLDYDWFDDENGIRSLERGLDRWLPLLPAIGIRWEF